MSSPLDSSRVGMQGSRLMGGQQAFILSGKRPSCPNRLALRKSVCWACRRRPLANSRNALSYTFRSDSVAPSLSLAGVVPLQRRSRHPRLGKRHSWVGLFEASSSPLASESLCEPVPGWVVAYRNAVGGATVGVRIQNSRSPNEQRV